MASALLSEPKVVAEIKTNGLLFREVSYPVEFWMSAHRHDEIQLFLCLGGAIEHQVGRDGHCLEEKSVGYVPNDEKHSDLFFGEVRTFDIVLGDDHRGVRPKANASQVFHRHDRPAALMMSAYQEFRNPDSYTPIMLEALTVELLVSLERQHRQSVDNAHPIWLNRVRDLLHEEFSESLRLDRIASEAGVHPAHLTKAFRQRFGQSIGEYVRRLRVAKARHLLEVSDIPIGDIALAAGFVDQSHFTRTFKKYTGKTPNAYRGDRS